VILLEVTLEQSYAGQEVINRWTYLGQGVPAAVSMSFALTSALGAVWDEISVPPEYPDGSLMRILAEAQHNGVSFQTVTCKDVYSAIDFYSTVFINPLVGVQGGEGLSPVLAFGFRTNRVRSDIRRATKRFVGVPEAQVGTLGVIVGGFIISHLIPLAEKMAEALSYDDEGNTLTFIPCVVKKERYNPETQLPDPEGTAYRYFEDPQVQEDFIASGVLWEPYEEVRSQVSRQYGRGR
jgi:hypothetical protein